MRFVYKIIPPLKSHGAVFYGRQTVLEQVIIPQVFDDQDRSVRH